MSMIDLKPAEVTDIRGTQKMIVGPFTEVGLDAGWDQPVWRLFYATVMESTGECRDTFVRTVPGNEITDGTDAVRWLSRHYAGSGVVIVLIDVLGPMSVEQRMKCIAANAARPKQVTIECPTRNASHQQPRSMGPGSGRGSAAVMSPPGERALPERLPGLRGVRPRDGNDSGSAGDPLYRSLGQ